jgi:hypothetical protein
MSTMIIINVTNGGVAEGWCDCPGRQYEYFILVQGQTTQYTSASSQKNAIPCTRNIKLFTYHQVTHQFPVGRVDQKMWKGVHFIIKFGMNPHRDTWTGDDANDNFGTTRK